MTYMIIFILLVLLIILSIALIRYHLALKNLSQQIEDKILTGSMKRVGVSIFSKHFLHLYQQIENLFQEVEQSRLVMKREKQTLDMAISNIAHDIRTPLTIASGYTQQLIKSPEDKSETLQKIAQHLDLVSKRLEALLEYRRLMEGAVKPKLEEVDLSAFITKKTLAYYDVFQAANITLDFKVEAGLKMRTDEDLLDRILQNLLGNVLKHPKKIFTKEELYELVWEESYLPGDNTLNTHLSNLRKKLNQLDPNQEYIETIWGVGVRLKGDKQ